MEENRNIKRTDQQKKPPRMRRNRTPRKPMKNDDDFNWGKVTKVVLSWSAIILGVFILMTLFRSQDSSEFELAFTEYQKLLSNGLIESAVVKKSDLSDYQLHGSLKEMQEVVTASGKTVKLQRFTVTLPYLDDNVVKNWNDKNIRFSISKEDSTWMNALFSALPWVGLLVVWLIIMRRMQGVGTKGIFSFGKSRAKVQNEGAPKVTFQDVAGARDY
jgi:cell division protease FtsH